LPKVVTDKIKEKVIRYYLTEGQTIDSTARKFNLGRVAVHRCLHQVDDPQLKYEIAIKTTMFGQSSKIPMVNIWGTLDKAEMTKNELIDWYIAEDGPDCLSVKQLIQQARQRGIKVTI
jgi:predicted DNA-binding protein YlxM (UPF0122 family)